MTDIFTELNPAQRAAAEQTEGAVLLVAGAGSGKTRVLTHRIAGILEAGKAFPSEVLAITFTNKAANEMKSRLERMLGGGSESMWICTIHSMCVRILRRFSGRIGYTENFSIYSDQDKERVLRRILADLGYDLEHLKHTKWMISDVKNKGLTSDEYFHGSFSDDDRKLFEAYEQTLKESNALDFDDLLTRTAELLSAHEDVRTEFSERFRYIHIDEFQDTNEVQYDIVRMLSSAHGNVFAVGDDDQSIYAFRGAKVENMQRFLKDYPSAKVMKLEQNYRSTKKILAAANEVIGKNPNRMEKVLWTENEEGGRVECRVLDDELREAGFVASTIIRLKSEYPYLRWSDFGVLMRVNALTRSFEQEFLKYNIPFKIYGGFKFFERKEVKDLISYLRLLLNPFDEESLLRVINVPRRGIGDAAIAELRSYARSAGVTLFDAVLSADESGMKRATVNKLLAFKSVILQLLTDMQLLPLGEFAARCVNVSGLRDMYSSGSEEDISRSLNLDEFVASVQGFAADNEGAGLSEYIESVTLQSDIDEESGDAVTLATVHAVKGLEFEVVFVVGLEEKIFPIVRIDTTEADYREERRLMYVAVTRAKKLLYLTHARSRYMFGERKYTLQSQYFKEIQQLFSPPTIKLSEEEGSLTSRTAAPMPSYTPERKQAPPKPHERFVAGAAVFHPKFGDGIIVDTSGEGPSKYVDVGFKGIGVKKFALQFAPLELKGE